MFLAKTSAAEPYSRDGTSEYVSANADGTPSETITTAHDMYAAS